MNIFNRWYLSKIFETEVRQGYDHKRNLENLYGMIYDVAKKEFYEDNKPTLDAFLKECFEKSQKGNFL